MTLLRRVGRTTRWRVEWGREGTGASIAHGSLRADCRGNRGGHFLAIGGGLRQLCFRRVAEVSAL
jgi:hypothetical protein